MNSPTSKPWYVWLFNILTGLLTKQGLAQAAPGASMATASLPLGSGYDRLAEEDRKRAAIVAFMEANVGDPYTYGAEIRLDDPDPATGDCSEYTEQAYLRAGLGYPDGVVNQVAFCAHRRVLEPKPGDPFFYSPNPATGIPHTGIYVGDGMVIHAKGRPERRVIKVTRAEVEAHPRFLGWFRHPDLSWPLEERA